MKHLTLLLLSCQQIKFSKVLVQIFVVFLITGCGGGNESTSKYEKFALSPDEQKTLHLAASEGYIRTLSSAEQKTIDLAVSEGNIRFIPDFNEVWVKPEFWNALPFEIKKNLGAMSAIYCANKKGIMNPEGEPMDSVVMIFQYKKGSQIFEFSPDKLPKDTDQYEFIARIDKVYRTDLYSVNVMDEMSGKKIANYSQSHGFEVY